MRALAIGIVFFVGISGWAQCPIPDFSLASTGCLNQNFYVQDNTTGATSFEWDFCSGDIELTPNSDIAVSNTLLFRTRSIRVVKNSGNWYGFTIDQASSPNRLIRFNFGASLLNNPAVTDLGNPSGLLNGAFDFQMYFEAGNWYALVANSGGNTILKLTFGSSLDVTPTIQDLGSFGVLETPNGITIVNDNGSLMAFVANGTSVATSKIVRLDFGTTINNTPSAASFTVTGGSTLRGISIVRECDRWFGLVTSYQNGRVYWLDFVDGITDAPQSGEMISGYSFPSSISIVVDGGNYFALTQSAIGPLYRLSFGTSIIDKIATNQNLGSFGITQNFATEWVKENSNWYGFSIDLGNRRLIRYTFPTTCDAAVSVYSGITPPVNNYTTDGTKRISLAATNAMGAFNTMSKTIAISTSTSPDIAFTSQNICVNHDINFTSQNISGNITGYDWDFGDTNSSTDPNPIHQYSSSNEYIVELEVTASNGCTNLIRQPLTTYAEPVADFTTPSVSPVCTNQNFVFDNTSVFNAGYVPTWEWRVNGSVITTNEDLSYTFLNTSNHEIRLKASIPGCENEMIKNINSLVDGPTPDFSFAGQCEEEDVTFTNNSTGTISGYFWDFDDSQNSTDPNPTHIFSDAGIFDVTLTASNAAGCNNTVSNQVTIYTAPQVNFAPSLPPFSCNGTPTLFNDLTPNPTDSNIASWAWNFGDAGSSQNTSTLRNPQHTYENAGGYNVSLLVTTNFFCSATIQLPVIISQSPVANFNNTFLCEDVVVHFSDASTGTIDSWDWVIGSTVYTTQNPTHTFVNSGNTNATLTVTASNDCIHSFNTAIVVPAKLTPDFSVSRNCTEQQTLFTDITNATADPVSSHSWNFGGLGTASGSPATFTFLNTGNVNVTLNLTTQTGCEYPVLKAVNIGSPPQSNFTTSPETGSPPLIVEFTNTSTGSITYLWNFSDLSTSTQVSPSFTFEDVGEYEVSLIAYNAFDCSDTTYHEILVSPITGLEQDGNFYFEPPYPNPGNGNLFLGWTALQPGNLSVTVLDIFGRTILASDLLSAAGHNETVISLSGLKAGVYFMQMRLGERKKTFRVTVNPE